MSREARTRERWIVLALAGLGLALRLHGLGDKALWTDEENMLRNARSDLGHIFQTWAQPLYYAFLHVWGLVVGETALLLRLPAALLGTAGAWVTWALAREIAPRRVAMLVLVLVVVDPFHVMHSQSVRWYTATYFLMTCATLQLVRGIRYGRRADWIRFAALGLVASLTDFWAAGFLVVELLAVVGAACWWSPGGATRRQLAAGACAVLALSGTGLWRMAAKTVDIVDPQRAAGRTAFQLSEETPYVQDPLSLDFLASVGSAFVGTEGEPGLSAAAAVFAGLAAIGLVTLAGRARRLTVLFCSLGLAPFAALAGLALLDQAPLHAVYVRYLIFLLAPYLILVSLGAWRLVDRVPARAAVASVALLPALMLPTLGDYYTTPKRDWRGMAEFLRRNVAAGDVVACRENWQSVGLLRYLKDHPSLAPSLEEGRLLIEIDGNPLVEEPITLMRDCPIVPQVAHVLPPRVEGDHYRLLDALLDPDTFRCLVVRRAQGPEDEEMPWGEPVALGGERIWFINAFYAVPSHIERDWTLAARFGTILDSGALEIWCSEPVPSGLERFNEGEVIH